MSHEVRDTRYGYAVCCTQCEVWVMCSEIWIMRIAVSNVVSEYSLGGVNWHEKSIRNHGIMCSKNLYVLYNRLCGYLSE